MSGALFTQLVGAGGLKIVAMPGGVGSNPDGVPTRKGTKILRACAVALTRDMVAEVGPTGVRGKISVATKRCGPRLEGGRCSAGGIVIATKSPLVSGASLTRLVGAGGQKLSPCPGAWVRTLMGCPRNMGQRSYGRARWP